MRETLIPFWGGPLSNFSDLSKIEYKGMTFDTSEQIFMYQKAVFFKDFNTAEKILETGQNPARAKRLGRQVKNYNDLAWSNVRFEAMKEALRAKFKVESYRDVLLSTDNAELVEASPYDRVWGIGFITSEITEDRSKWGENLLGKALMEIREELRNVKP